MTRQSLAKIQPSTDLGHNGPIAQQHAQTFSGGWPTVIDIQVRLRFREPKERAAISASGVPRPRVQQILETVLKLPFFETVQSSQLRVDVHRADSARWMHFYGLALAMGMVSSLTRRPIPSQHLLIGDVDLGGNVRDVWSDWVDCINEAIEKFDIESPVTLLLAPDSARWIKASSTTRVVPCAHIRDAVAALWPNQQLFPQ